VSRDEGGIPSGVTWDARSVSLMLLAEVTL
jgi:hypothetical protein